MCLRSVLKPPSSERAGVKSPMRLHIALLALFFISTGLMSGGQETAAAAQTAPASTAQAGSAPQAIASASAALTCADLRLVPAVRGCTAVATIPIGGLGFFVSAINSAEDGFTAEDLVEQTLGKRSVHADARRRID